MRKKRKLRKRTAAHTLFMHVSKCVKANLELSFFGYLKLRTLDCGEFQETHPYMGVKFLKIHIRGIWSKPQDDILCV